MDALFNSYKLKWPELPWPPSNGDEKSRVIRGPLWPLSEIQGVAKDQLREARRVIPVTRDCLEDLQKLSFNLDDVARLMLQLQAKHYENSVWCMATPNEGVAVRPERLWYPCDAYAITRVEHLDSGWSGQVNYYLKFCVHNTKSLILLLSAHLQG